MYAGVPTGAPVAVTFGTRRSRRAQPEVDELHGCGGESDDDVVRLHVAMNTPASCAAASASAT